MSYLATPLTPNIAPATEYFYVIPQQGASSITADANADFTLNVAMGEPALLKLTYTGTAPTFNNIFRSVVLRIHYPDGSVVAQTINFIVYPNLDNLGAN